mmetsp:Transcript_982/g.3080  ORF Transcript_982/g.3080 Transcript_982/m.3080 type:complete len:263 (-) Transcript_982:110-898(-)
MPPRGASAASPLAPSSLPRPCALPATRPKHRSAVARAHSPQPPPPVSAQVRRHHRRRPAHLRGLHERLPPHLLRLLGHPCHRGAAHDGPGRGLLLPPHHAGAQGGGRRVPGWQRRAGERGAPLAARGSGREALPPHRARGHGPRPVRAPLRGDHRARFLRRVQAAPRRGAPRHHPVHGHDLHHPGRHRPGHGEQGRQAAGQGLDARAAGPDRLGLRVHGHRHDQGPHRLTGHPIPCGVMVTGGLESGAVEHREVKRCPQRAF